MQYTLRSTRSRRASVLPIWTILAIAGLAVPTSSRTGVAGVPSSQPTAQPDTKPAAESNARDAKPKLPVPAEAAQHQAEKQLKEIVGDRIARAKTAPERVALAGELKQTAAETAEPALKFVLLRDARDLLVNAGDVDAAIAAQGELRTTFKTEGTPVAVDVWQQFSRGTLSAADWSVPRFAPPAVD